MALLRRFAVTIAGVALLALGAALMVLPGPGILVIVAGLAVLATEYAWARRLLVRAKGEAEKAQHASVASPLRLAGTVLFGLALGGLGLAMLLARDVELPLWNPVTGGVMVATGAILLGTTGAAYRSARRGDGPSISDPSPAPRRAGSIEVDTRRS